MTALGFRLVSKFRHERFTASAYDITEPIEDQLTGHFDNIVGKMICGDGPHLRNKQASDVWPSQCFVCHGAFLAIAAIMVELGHHRHRKKTFPCRMPARKPPGSIESLPRYFVGAIGKDN